jgi:hypothetical protein
LVLVLVFLGFVPQLVEFTLNRVAASTSSSVPPQTRELHEALEIVDLHADSFLWERWRWKSLRVTKTPRGLNYERNEGNSGNIFWLALAQRWPPGTWNRSALSIWRNGLSVLRLPPTASSFPSAQPRISQAICSSEKRIAGSPRIRGTSQQHSWSMHFAALVTLRLCLSVS